MSDFRLIPFTVQNISEAVNEIPDGVKAVHAPDVWGVTKGNGKVVAIIDTGADYNHPDLKDRIIGGANFSSDYNGDQNNFMDNNGHGTHVAGTIGATLDNAGVVGVAPEVKLLIVKVLGGNGSGSYDAIINGINYATNWRGANGEKVRVISMSLGGPQDVSALHDAVKKAVNNGIMVVCAAGNEGDNNPNTNEFSYPGAYPEVVEVGAVDFNGVPATFTNTNNEVDIVAPGVGILSTYPSGKYATLSGTSMATPHVSGGVAILIAKREVEAGRELTESEIYAEVVKHTRDLGLNRNFQGNGMLDLTKVVDSPQPSPQPTPTPTPTPTPEKPKKRFDIYIKPTNGGYSVQVGFYKVKANAIRKAEELKAELEKTGDEVNISLAEAESKSFDDEE